MYLEQITTKYIEHGRTKYLHIASISTYVVKIIYSVIKKCIFLEFSIRNSLLFASPIRMNDSQVMACLALVSFREQEIDKSASATENGSLIFIQKVVSSRFVNTLSCFSQSVLQVYNASLIPRHERRWQWWREKVRYNTLVLEWEHDEHFDISGRNPCAAFESLGEGKWLDWGAQAFQVVDFNEQTLKLRGYFSVREAS